MTETFQCLKRHGQRLDLEIAKEMRMPLATVRQHLTALAERREVSVGDPESVIEIPNDFAGLLKSNPAAAKAEALRIREEFLRAFSAGLICRAFERDDKRPKYLLYREA